jgi:hypothetical protein
MAARLAIVAGAISIAILGGGAIAEPAATAPPSSADDSAYLANEPLEACMKRWDAGTHMTKDAWRETCRRVSKERVPYTKGR